MTISTTASSTTVVLIAAQTVVPFSFIADAASDITVQTTNTSTGASTTLTASQYTVTLNSATTGQLWSVGGYVTLNSALGVGYTCTITRTLPLQQLISIQNQGDFAPQVTEQALDTLCMEIQQVSARGGSYRGVWATNIVYNFGDIVQDGINGAYTNNLYVCAIANTSGTWATDLASGDWALALNVQTINVGGTYLPLAGGTISGNLGVTGTTTLSGNATVGGTLGVTGATTLSGGGTTPTLTAGSNSTGLANAAYADQTNFLGSASNLKSNVTTAGSSATFTADEIVLGVALGGSGIKIGSYSKTVNLSTTGAGGMDTGTAPVSGFVSVYAIQGTSGTSILACNVTTSSGTIYSGANLPSGYTKSALIGIWPTNGSSQFVVGTFLNRQFIGNPTQLVSAGNVGSFTSVSLSSCVPTVAKSVQISGNTSTNNGAGISISAYSSGFITNTAAGALGTSTGSNFTGSCPIVTSQTIWYTTGSGGAYSFSATGYTI